MEYLTTFIFGVILLSASTTSQAIILGFSPSSQDVSLGSGVGVDLTISGLGDFAPDSLGGFDMVSYLIPRYRDLPTEFMVIN